MEGNAAGWATAGAEELKVLRKSGEDFARLVRHSDELIYCLLIRRFPNNSNIDMRCKNYLAVTRIFSQILILDIYTQYSHQ